MRGLRANGGAGAVATVKEKSVDHDPQKKKINAQRHVI